MTPGPSRPRRGKSLRLSTRAPGGLSSRPHRAAERQAATGTNPQPPPRLAGSQGVVSCVPPRQPVEGSREKCERHQDGPRRVLGRQGAVAAQGARPGTAEGGTPSASWGANMRHSQPAPDLRAIDARSFGRGVARRADVRFSESLRQADPLPCLCSPLYPARQRPALCPGLPRVPCKGESHPQAPPCEAPGQVRESTKIHSSCEARFLFIQLFPPKAYKSTD